MKDLSREGKQNNHVSVTSCVYPALHRISSQACISVHLHRGCWVATLEVGRMLPTLVLSFLIRMSELWTKWPLTTFQLLFSPQNNAGDFVKPLQLEEDQMRGAVCTYPEGLSQASCSRCRGGGEEKGKTESGLERMTVSQISKEDGEHFFWGWSPAVSGRRQSFCASSHEKTCLLPLLFQEGTGTCIQETTDFGFI